MDNSWARPALELPGSDAGTAYASHPADASGQADDPLGDEAAFPSTWQSLVGIEPATAD
jgi:hypothetical protein